MSLSSDAKRVLGVISDNSPLSTKELKAQAKRQFGVAGPGVEKAMAELWKRLLVVGYGEVDDGAFPSLAVGATDAMFEKWCSVADSLDASQAQKKLEKKLGSENPFYLELQKTLRSLKPMETEKVAPTKKQTKLRTLRYEDLVGR